MKNLTQIFKDRSSFITTPILLTAALIFSEHLIGNPENAPSSYRVEAPDIK